MRLPVSIPTSGAAPRVTRTPSPTCGIVDYPNDLDKKTTVVTVAVAMGHWRPEWVVLVADGPGVGLPLDRCPALEPGGPARPASIFRPYVVPPGRGGVFHPRAHRTGPGDPHRLLP